MRRIGKAALGALGAFVSAFAVLAVCIGLLLFAGPLSFGFLSDYVSDSLVRNGVPFRLTFDDVQLRWDSHRRRLRARLTGGELHDIEGVAIAGLSAGRLAFDGGELLRGRLVLTEMALTAPSLTIIRRHDGTLSLGVGGEADTGSEGAGLRVLQGFANPSGRLAIGDLDRFTIAGASVTLLDEASGRRFETADTALTTRVDGKEARLELQGRLDLAGGPVEAALSLVHDGDHGETSIRADFGNLHSSGLAQLLGPALLPARLAALTTRFSGSLVTALHADGGLGPLALELRGAAGQWSGPDLYDTPIAFDGFELAADIAVAERIMHVSRFALDLSDAGRLQFAGTLEQSPDGFGVEGQASLARLDRDLLLRYWPAALGTGARQWVERHIRAAGIADVAVALNLPANGQTFAERPADSVVLSWRFEDTVADYLPPLPALRQARGTGRLNLRELRMTVERAKAEALSVEKGHLLIPNLPDDVADLELHFHVAGDAAAAWEVIGREPLRFTSKLGLDRARASGHAAFDVQLRLPLLQSLPAERVAATAKGRLERFALSEAFGGRRLNEGRLDLEADNDGLRANGAVEIDGVPMSVRWSRDFAGADSADRLALAATIGSDLLREKGLDLGEALSGPVALSATVVRRPDGRMEASGIADLYRARLALPALAWEKPPNRRAVLTFGLQQDAEGAVDLHNLSLTSDDLQASGRAGLDAAGTLRRFDLDSLKQGENDLAARFRRGGDGRDDLRIEARHLDLRALLDSSSQDGQDDLFGERPLRLLLIADRLRLQDEILAERVGLRGTWRDNGWRDLQADARLGGVPVRLRGGSEGSDLLLELRADDAGALGRALDLTRAAEGGALTLLLRIPDAADAPWGGTLQVRDFKVREAPLLAQILSLGSVTGLLDVLGGEGIQFDWLDAPFIRDESGIRFAEARAAGAALGLAVSGLYAPGTGALDLQGTVVPAYTLSSAIGQIPLVGSLLAGQGGKGVLAIRFAATGTSEDPQVSVNPLTALAPGILRDIIEGFSERAGQPAAESDAAGFDQIYPEGR